MSELVYITTCKLCAPGRAWQIDGKGVDPASPILGQTPAKRTERFFLALYAHLQQGYTSEMEIMTKAQKNGRFNDPNPAAVAAWCMEHGRHIAAFQGVLAATQCSQAFTILSAFYSQDPELLKTRELARYQLHTFSRPALEQLSDEALERRVNEMNADDHYHPEILALLKDVRDQSLGLGSYTPEEFRGKILQPK